MGKLKNLLKYVLPPPVNTFNREINSLRQLILEQNKVKIAAIADIEEEMGGEKTTEFIQLKNLIENMQQELQYMKKKNDDLRMLLEKNSIKSLPYINMSMQRLENGMVRSLPITHLTNFVLNVCDHCNLRCKGCDHFACIADERFVPLESIQRDVFRMAELTNGEVDYIGIMGGEPLLHPDIIEIMVAARQALPKTWIRVVTNGILLLNMSEDFWNCCRDNDITIVNTKYPINLKYEQIQETARAHGVKFEFYGNSGKVQKTSYKLPLDINGRQNPSRSFWRCFHVHSCMFVSDGKFYPCTMAPNIQHFNKKFGTNLEITEDDYLDIYKVQNKNEIFEFLAKPIPFCRYCMTDKRTFGHPWERSKQQMSEWTLCE